MYVCVCNAYRESHVRDAIQKSAGSGTVTVEQVYARLGSGPRCGWCLMYVKDLIEASREKSTATDASQAALRGATELYAPSSPGSIWRCR